MCQGIGPLQLSATFNGSGRQTSAYGEWMSSTISDSGTWVTTGTAASTDSSTLSLSFSGGVTLGEGGPGVRVSGSHERASRSTAATAYNAEKGWHTTSGSRSQSGSGSGNVGTTAGYGIVGGSGAGFSYEFSLNSTSGPSGTSTTSGSASATLSWSGTGDTGQTGSGITVQARYDDGDGWQIVSVGPATTAGSAGGPEAGDLGTAAAGDDAQFSGDESSRQGQAAANGKGDAAAGELPQRTWWEWLWGKQKLPGEGHEDANNSAHHVSGALVGLGNELQLTGAIRAEYAARAAALAPNDKAAREALKNEFRAKQTALGKAITTNILDSRAGQVPSARNAARTNPGINAAGTAMRYGGRAMVAAGAAMDVYEVMSAPEGEKVRAAAHATGRFGGGVAGGWLGAQLGVAGGPWGVVIGAVVGGVAGALGGEQLVNVFGW